MKRMIARIWCGLPGRRRLPVQAVLECLEDRLALSATVPIPITLAAGAVPLVVPSNPAPPQASGLNTLLAFGGGKTQAIPQFPASGGGGRTEGESKPVASQTANEQPDDETAFDASLHFLDVAAVQLDRVESALGQAAEAVAMS